jgi:hypothetical protein
MIDDQEQRGSWRAGWLSSIQEFADEDTQRRLWLDPKTNNPHFSLVEYRCCYFDDLGLSGGYDWPLTQGYVTAAEVSAVHEFHAIAGAYDSPTNSYDNEAVLADPAWAGVVAAAKRAQAALLALIEDRSERRLLLEP